MTNLERELQQLKKDIIEMMDLVRSQINKGREALFNNDKDLAREVLLNEKRVNATELSIDKDCENIFALFNPVAVDLRFVLAVLKINTNLERIGDNAEGIAKYVLDIEEPPEKELMKKLEFAKMYDTADKMLVDVVEAFDKEDPKLARTVFQMDDILDDINQEATKKVADFIHAHPKKTYQSVYSLSIIRKLERVGDQTKNIAEETIFYIEAKVLKHKKKKEKL